MDAIKSVLSKASLKCAIPNINDKGHKSKQESILFSAPEVFVINLQWDGLPSSLDICKILISIPVLFEVDDLFEKTSDNSKYTFKGLICFQAAHYLSFFRRVPVKVNSVLPI